ncbi:MAG TPA: hypothetical protein VFF06_17985 [Polyangia bacterium]|nr:hypothetical protein [Polyangia bacterium]
MLEDVFLLLIFTVLCGILVALWRIREQLEKMSPASLAPPKPDEAAKPPAS